LHSGWFFPHPTFPLPIFFPLFFFSTMDFWPYLCQKQHSKSLPPSPALPSCGFFFFNIFKFFNQEEVFWPTPGHHHLNLEISRRAMLLMSLPPLSLLLVFPCVIGVKEDDRLRRAPTTPWLLPYFTLLLEPTTLISVSGLLFFSTFSK